jgi:hypothetical protein
MDFFVTKLSFFRRPINHFLINYLGKERSRTRLTEEHFFDESSQKNLLECRE